MSVRQCNDKTHKIVNWFVIYCHFLSTEDFVIYKFLTKFKIFNRFKNVFS